MKASARTAAVLAAAGAALTITGIWLVYPPAAFITAGAAIGALALFGLDIKGGDE